MYVFIMKHNYEVIMTSEVMAVGGRRLLIVYDSIYLCLHPH